MGGQLMGNIVQQLVAQSPNTQSLYVNKPINNTINPYPNIGQMFPNLDNSLLLNNLSAPNMQQTNNQQSSGAGRFSGLLGSPIVTTNTQGK